LGEHEVELRLHADVNATLKVRVESSTPLPDAAAIAAQEAAKREEQPKTEKRGRKSEAPAAEKEEKKARPAKAKAAKAE
jgi:hypothetical protein